MSTPNVRTPVTAIVFILRDMTPWKNGHLTKLQGIIEGTDDLAQRFAQAAQRLDDAQRIFESELRDDVMLTEQQQSIVKQTQQLGRSSRHAAELAFSHRGDVKKIMLDFASPRPAKDVRTVREAHNALRRMDQAWSKHGEHIKSHVLIADQIIARIKTLIAELDALQSAQTREVIETRDARYERDEARDEALRLIRRGYDIAQIVAALQGDEALRQLLFIFSRHLATRSARPKKSNAERDELELDEDALDSFDDGL